MKRGFDIVVALAALVLLSPLMAVTACVIRYHFGAPVLFRQERLGRGGTTFILRKFRTMTSERDSEGSLLPDHARLTSVGRFLRKTSIDELPELFNVLRGEMSLVGPRPLLPRYLPYFTEAERVRFEVPPGITGWAQVNGRNCLSWEKRFEFDVWYVKNQSLLMDLYILLKTVSVVFSRRGVEVDPAGVMSDLDLERSRKIQNNTGRKF